MKYYKILNKDENHHNLQYKTGLNVDPIPFNPRGNCKPGGIYFSREDILAYLGYGCWIREVTLPENEEIYEETGNPKKFKAHSVILGERREINLEVIKELVNEGVNVHVNNDCALRFASENGHVEIVKFLVSKGANVNACNDYPLQSAANNGHLEIVKFLVSEGANVHSGNYCALRFASENGHLEIVKFLVSVGANVHSENDVALRWAVLNGHDMALRCAVENGHLEIVEYLKGLK